MTPTLKPNTIIAMSKELIEPNDDETDSPGSSTYTVTSNAASKVLCSVKLMPIAAKLLHHSS